MALALRFMPKTILPMPSFKIFQHLRQGVRVFARPPRPPSNSGNRGQINRDPVTSPRISHQSVKESEKSKAKGDSATKPKALN